MAGFKYRKSQAGGGTTGNVSTFAVDAAHATLLAPGDAVIITGDGDANGVSEVDTGAAATANTGVLESVQVVTTDLTETGLAALTTGLVRVRVDQFALYEIDADATYNADSVGLNTGINITTATKSGSLTISNMTADFATVATTQTLPYRVVALLEDDAGVLGNRVLVRPNASTASDGAAGIA